MASIFGRLGRSVTRHHRAIIVLWVVIFLALISFAPLANQAVVYDDNSGGGRESLESTIAKQWIEQRFGQVADQGSVIVVLSSSSVTGASTRDSVLAIQKAISESSFSASDGTHVNVHVTSIYTQAENYTDAFISHIGGVYQTTYVLANASRYAVFHIPLSFWTLYNCTVEMKEIVYGIPFAYLVNWNSVNSTNPSASLAWKDAAVYGLTNSHVRDWIANATLDPAMSNLALTFLSLYAAEWNATAIDPNLTAVPHQRAQAALDTGFAQLSQSSSFASLTPDQRSSAISVRGNFSLDNFSGKAVTDRYCEGLYEVLLANRTAPLPQDQRELAQGYFGVFYTGWVSLQSSPDLPQFRSLVSSAVNVTSKQLSGDLGPTLVSLYETLGWGGWLNDSRLASFTIDLVGLYTGSQPWIVRQVVSYGPNATVQNAQLARAVVKNCTLDDFPVLLAPALVGGFVDSPKNDTMLVSLSFTTDSGASVSGTNLIPQLRQVFSEGTADSVNVAYITGLDAIRSDIKTSMNEDLARIDPVTILLVIVLIGIFFRSFVSSSIPPMVIGMALGISYAVIYFIGTYAMAVNYNVLTLLISSMLGAGCDYCIFILSRYREERAKGVEKVKAIETSVSWAGEAIATSGATVIIGFGMLSFGRLDVLRSMGTLAIGISLALLMALTLLPSIIMLLGDGIFWPAKVRAPKVNANLGYFAKSARFSVKHAKAIVIAALLISVPATYLVLTLETSYDYIASMPDSQSKQGLDVMAAGFGGGKVIPTYVGVGLSTRIYNSTGGYDPAVMNAVENLSRSLAALPNVESVVGPTRPYGETIDYLRVSGNVSISAVLNDQYMRTMVGDDNRSVLLTVTFKNEPYASPSVSSIISIRNVGGDAVGQNREISAVLVGGGTAATYDVSVMTQQDFGGIAVLVVVGIFLVLMFVLGSILVPARSIATIMISASWTLALTLLLFQYVVGTSVVWIVPMVLLVVCLGLGLDYDILLVTRVREEILKGKSDEEAIVHAVDQTGGIITACGFIMAAAFGTMMLSQSMMLREFGFALSLAILLDAFFVRIYLFPAMMSLMGKWNWYAPKFMKRKDRPKDD